MKITGWTTLFFFLLLGVIPLHAQKTSKSKAAEKLYEKGTVPRNVEIKNTNQINTEHLEFSPAFYSTGLVFVSSRKSKGPVDKKINTTFFQLYYADTDRNGMPLKPEPFSSTVNSQLHEGPVSFDQKGTKMYFTRNVMKGGFGKRDSKDKVQLEICEATKGLYDWKDIKVLPFNSKEYKCAHPSLSPDGQRLYFASNMPGGFGGMDLYVAERAGDSWAAPQNLGNKINTEQNEVFPFIHESGSLFFASEGHDSYGGLDIFTVDYENDPQSPVQNLRTPFNTVADDLGFILDREGTRGYFSSNREGGFGKDDVYFFEAKEGIKGVEAPSFIPSTITAKDMNTLEPINQTAIRIFERAADGFIEGDNIYDLQLVPDADGEMTMKLIRKKDADLGEPKIVTNPDGEAETEFKSDRQYIILASKEGYKPAEMTFSTVGKTEPQKIEMLLEANACLTLYGTVKSQPYNTAIPNATVVVVNECDGTEEVLRSNINGKFETCLPQGCDFSIRASQTGYENGATQVSTVKIRGSRSLETQVLLTAFTNDIVNEPIRMGTVIVLENIYYDFNKSSIRSGAARELDALVEMMQQYPSMEIEMIAHTDSRGSSKYNLDLSLRRAESAKRYLESRGISGSRIKTFGYGESQPRNRCEDGVDCTEVEHQYNRRTEVKIVKINEGVDVKYQDDGPEVIDRKRGRNR
ncbi:MAG: OmpA family protein [Saprospiraceae bacterium]